MVTLFGTASRAGLRFRLNSVVRLNNSGTGSAAALGCGEPFGARGARLDTLSAAEQQQTFLHDVCAWLLVNSMSAEGLQFARLCQQSLRNVWRKAAFRTMLRAAEQPGHGVAPEQLQV